MRFVEVAPSQSDVGRSQLELYGERLDGEVMPAEERLRTLHAPTFWRTADESRERFELILSNVDSGAVFRAGTLRLVGLVIQSGFSGTDLEAWEQLSSAERPPGFPPVDFSIGDDTGPRLLGASEVRIESAWRALRVVVAPWDEAGIITRVVTATGDDEPSGRMGATGAPLAFFSADRVKLLDEALRRVPEDAVAQRADALEAAADAEADYREPEWLAGILDALRALAAAGEPIVAQVV